ncbi:tyrosine-type recombinase/integrase [Thermoflexus sp.]|uniref:tyrosine-type recombinase/integrase n=1 Tax=Thermoflexus sp. TaxID=1969742 RepID=UPI0035E45E57
MDPSTLAIKRHHLHSTGVQRAITAAVRAAGITQRATAHTLHAAFALRLKEAGYQIDDIQKLMGHADIRTTRHDLESQPPVHQRLRRCYPPDPDATPPRWCPERSERWAPPKSRPLSLPRRSTSSFPGQGGQTERKTKTAPAKSRREPRFGVCSR